MKKEYDLFLPWQDDGKNDIYNLIKPEFFFRLNPHWAIEEFTIVDDSYSLDIIDHETKNPIKFHGTYRKESNDQLMVSAVGHDWLTISFFSREGSLMASVAYPEEPTEEQEQHLVFWLRSVKEYLRLHTKNNLYSKAFKKIMDRVILPMTPSQRKICLMLTRLTVLEFAVIIIIGGGYFLFMR